MSDNQRHRRETANPRYFDVDSATVIEIGDMAWLDTDDVKPASDFTWNTSLAQTQADFKAKFIGMSADRSRAGDTDQVGVDKNGVKEFTCAAATFEVGDLVGPAKASGNALENQKVVSVASEDYAIGRVAKRYSSSTTTVEIDIRTMLDDFSNNDTTASIIANIEASGTLTADAIIDGTTNHVFTALDDTKLAGIEALADVTDATNVAAAGAVMDSDITPGEGILRKTGAGAYTAHKTNLAATTAPTVNSDTTAGYSVGSLWCDTTADNVYVCIDATTGAAVWNQLMTPAQVSKLTGIEAAADVTDVTNVAAAGAFIIGTNDADDITDGTTNHVFTALDDTKLAGIEASADVTDATNVAAAGAFIIGTNDADDITDGTTNHVFTALDDTKLGNIKVDKLAAVVHTVTADEDTANQADVDTGLGSVPDVFIVNVLRAGVDVKADAVVTALGGGDAGKIRVADSGVTFVLTAGDVIHLMAAEV